MKTIKTAILYFVLVLFLSNSCFKNSNDEKLSFNDKNNQKYSISSNNVMLDIPYKKLETFIGSKFIPIYSKKNNLDTDNEDEVIIGYKVNTNDNIKIIIFDQMQNGIIKKKMEINTEILKPDSFELQSHNLLYDNDLSIIIEGKSVDDKSLLYIYQYSDDTYKKIVELKSDYSIIIDYLDIDTESGKKIKLKQITTFDAVVNDANTNIQEKKVYVWDYALNQLIIAESSRIQMSDRTLSNSNLNDPDKFLKYINGFWYPERYLNLIKSQNFDPDKFTSNNIEYILFSSMDMEVSIKHDDYINKYKIKKANLIWGQLPGVRLIIQGISNTSQFSTSTIDVVLTGSNSLQVTSSNKFDDSNYVRLDKPFIEYVNDRHKEIDDNNIKKIISFISDEFIINSNVNNKGIIINFISNNEFNIIENNKTEKGYYKITKDNIGYIITFLFDTENTILKSNNFLIKISEDTQSLSLTPVKMKIKGFDVEDSKKPFVFKKRNSG
jgi:hypothetical protein